MICQTLPVLLVNVWPTPTVYIFCFKNLDKKHIRNYSFYLVCSVFLVYSLHDYLYYIIYMYIYILWIQCILLNNFCNKKGKNWSAWNLFLLSFEQVYILCKSSFSIHTSVCEWFFFIPQGIMSDPQSRLPQSPIWNYSYEKVNYLNIYKEINPYFIKDFKCTV